MPTFSCPRCGSPVSLRRFLDITNKPFCSRCGWNLARADQALAAKAAFVRFIPLGIAAMLLFFIFVNARTNAPGMFLVPGIFLLIALLPIASYCSSKKALAAAKFTVNPDLALSQPPLDPALQVLQSVPRPRRVRFRFIGAAGVSVVAIFALMGAAGFFIATSRRSPGNKSDFTMFFPFFFMFVIILVLVVIPLTREKRNRPLLRDGELAFARVVSQRTVQQGKSSYSSIDYEFKTSSGLQIRSTACDLTNSVFEDMTIPVFYDPTNPDKNITPCATYLKVLTDPL
jgi:uncharacterized protein (DUF983 family)